MQVLSRDGRSWTPKMHLYIVESESCPITFAMSLWTVDCPPARLPSWKRFKKSPRYLVKQKASKRPRMWKIVAFFKRRNRRPHDLTFVLLLVFASCRHNRALRERIMVLSELEGVRPLMMMPGPGSRHLETGLAPNASPFTKEQVDALDLNRQLFLHPSPR